MLSGQFIYRSPGLTLGIDVLAIIFADGTARGWLLALRELMPASSTDVVEHARTLQLRDVAYTASRFAEHPCGGAARPAKGSIAPKPIAWLAGSVEDPRELSRGGSIELLGAHENAA